MKIACEIKLIFQYDFFDPIHMGEIEVLVPPHMRSHFEEIGGTLSFKSNLLVENYQE